MINAVLKNFPSCDPTAGNELQVRTWLGDVQSIPAYQVRSAFCPLSLLPILPAALCLLHPLPLLPLPFWLFLLLMPLLMSAVEVRQFVLHPDSAADKPVHSTPLLTRPSVNL